MTLSRLHVPPKEAAASHNTIAGPPPTSTFFSFPAAKNPMYRPSGDQNGKAARSVPGSERAVNAPSGRTHNRGKDPLCDEAETLGDATNANWRPSAERANWAGRRRAEFS